MSELPEGWAEATLGELVELKYGKSLPKKSRRDGPYNVYGSNGVVGTHVEALTGGETVVVGRKGSFGEVHVSTTACFPIDTTYYVDEFGELDPSFVAKLLRKLPLKEMNRATAIPGLNREDAYRLTVHLPPAPEQKRIAAKIDSLSAKSARARTELTKVEALVERYKLALLRNAFRGQLTAGWRTSNPDTEPVGALLNRVSPAEQPRGGRQATDTVIEGQAAISVNNPQSPSPNGWAWVPLSILARQETGHTPSRSHPEWWGGDIPWIGIRDAGAHHGKTIHETQQNTNSAGLANSAARLLPAGTVCLSRTASVGYAVIMGRPMATSQDFVTWSCTEALLPEYLQYALMAEGDDIRKFGRGTTHTTIYFPEVRAFHIHLAPVEEQKHIVQIIRTSFARIDRLAKAAKQGVVQIDALSAAVLRNAFEGRLVAQKSDDEPASTLLERLRSASKAATSPRTKRAPKSAAPRNHRRTSAMTKSRFDPDVAGQPYLSTLVETSSSPVPAEELYQRAQLTMPDFYKQLAFEVDEGFLVEGPGGLMRRT